MTKTNKDLIKLVVSKRLQKILSLLPNDIGVLADVGCDHGQVGVLALMQKKAQNVLFTDVSLPSLKKAERLSKVVGCFEKCKFVCGDGLCSQKVDVAVIAGMGGKEICKILADATELPEYLVLNPMRGLRETREFLQQHYCFLHDEILFDGKFYNIILLKKGQDNLTEMQLRYGKTNLLFFCKDFCDYLFEERTKCVTILDKASSPTALCSLNEIDLLLKGKINGQ